jgi:hypothetical protein
LIILEDKKTYNPEVPYNNLSILPQKKEIESTTLLKKTITASRALSELKGAICLILYFLLIL